MSRTSDGPPVSSDGLEPGGVCHPALAHSTDSKTAAIPWPTPMHMVANP